MIQWNIAGKTMFKTEQDVKNYMLKEIKNLYNVEPILDLRLKDIDIVEMYKRFMTILDNRYSTASEGDLYDELSGTPKPMLVKILNSTSTVKMRGIASLSRYIVNPDRDVYNMYLSLRYHLLLTNRRTTPRTLLLSLFKGLSKFNNLITDDMVIWALYNGESMVDIIRQLQSTRFGNALVRYKKLKASRYVDSLISLHGADNIVTVAYNDPLDNEDTIMRFDSLSGDDKIRYVMKWGILIPSYIPRAFKNNYIINEYVRAIDILTKKISPLKLPHRAMKTLDQMTDEEIMIRARGMNHREMIQFTNIVYPASGRTTYLESIPQYLNTDRPRWFLSVMPSERSIEKETLMLTEITDIETIFICYGTMRSYHSYEIDELITSFKIDDENPILRRPDNTIDSFTITEAGDLYSVLKMIPEIDDNTIKLISGLNKLICAIKLDERATEIRSRFNRFQEIEREIIANILDLIFYAGMYMRRWTGPGSPYPLDSHSTSVNIQPEVLTLPQIVRINEELERLNHVAKAFFDSLYLVEYANYDNVRFETETLIDRLHRVMAGHYCIRMASTGVLKAAMYYKVLFVGIPYEGVDPSAIAHIA